jgi:hypothetical protein
MARKVWCSCCGEKVTPAALKKHTDEAARQQNIAAMGLDPTPATTLKIAPITGNDVFESRARPLAPTVTPPMFDDNTSHSNNFAASPPLAASLPHFLSPHSINEDDFLPDPVQYVHDPPQVWDPPGHYPSMETSDGEDKDGEVQDGDEPDLEGFMDWEYLKQGNPCLLHRSYHVRS